MGKAILEPNSPQGNLTRVVGPPTTRRGTGHPVTNTCGLAGVTGTRSSAIGGDGKDWPEPAHSRLSVEDRFGGAPDHRVTVIR